jgi:ribosomal protein S18 acetylase RimI-like enzyme
MNDSRISLRPIEPADKGFLFAVYASTRYEELVPLGWSVEQQHAFLTQQFDAQHQYYQANYANSDFQIILVNDQPAGRLYLNRAINEIRIIDIALLPEYRNGGIGAALLNSLLVEAALEGKCVSIHVEKFNSALRLYERLGFSISDDRGVWSGGRRR